MFFNFSSVSILLNPDDQTLIENVWNFTLKTQQRSDKVWNSSHLPTQYGKVFTKGDEVVKTCFPSPHLMLSHQGLNIFSASEWLIIPDMRVVPSIAMMSHLCYYYNNSKVLKNIEANVSPGFIGNSKQCQCKETLVNKSTLNQPGSLLGSLTLKEGWIINGFVPYYFDYVTAENFLLWHKSIFCTKRVDGTKNICRKLWSLGHQLYLNTIYLCVYFGRCFVCSWRIMKPWLITKSLIKDWRKDMKLIEWIAGF